MADAGARRHDAEIVERILAPAQELVALAVALELDVDVLRQRVGPGEDVHLHRVVDHQIHRDQRIHLLRIAAQARDAVAHRGQIDHRGDAGEILHQDAGGLERHLLVGLALLQPAGDRLRVVHLVAAAVLEAQHVLQQDLQAHRQARDVAQCLRRLGQGEIIVALALHGRACGGSSGYPARLLSCAVRPVAGAFR